MHFSPKTLYFLPIAVFPSITFSTRILPSWMHGLQHSQVRQTEYGNPKNGFKCRPMAAKESKSLV